MYGHVSFLEGNLCQLLHLVATHWKTLRGSQDGSVAISFSNVSIALCQEGRHNTSRSSHFWRDRGVVESGDI